MSATIKNIEKLTTKLSKIATIDLTQPLTECCILVQDTAKTLCPVDDGQLRQSITHEIIGKQTGVVGTNVEYAPYVEIGTGLFSSLGTGRQTPWSYQDAEGNWYTTVGQHPQPFLKPALTRNKKEIKQTIQEEVRKELSKYANK